MKIVIDIPEEWFDRLQEAWGWALAENVREAIKRGAILPKGHGALKDADEVFSVMERNFDMQDLYLPIHFKQFALDEAKTIVEADKQCGDDCEHCEWVTCPKMEVDE